MKRIILISLGCVCLVLGAIGAALPLMPSFPFLLLASICFLNSSQRLDAWFKTTKLYKEVVEPHIKKEGILLKNKIKLCISCIFLFGVSIYFARKSLHLQIFLALVGLIHVLYFIFAMETKEKRARRLEKEAKEKGKFLNE